MVLREKNKIVVSCNCCNELGCGNLITFTEAHNRIWISCHSSDFYTKQFNLEYYLEKKLKRLKKSLKHKNNYFGEAILSKKDVQILLKNLKIIALSMKDDEEETENVFLHLELIKDEFLEEPEFILNLKGKISVFEILRNKEYRYHETSYSKKEILKYIKGVENALKKLEKEKEHD